MDGSKDFLLVGVSKHSHILLIIGDIMKKFNDILSEMTPKSSPVQYILNNQSAFRGKTFTHKCSKFVEGEGLVPSEELITIKGIGKQAILYLVDDSEEKHYARYDKGGRGHSADSLASIILTSPEAGSNPFWNKEINLKIAANRRFCKEKGWPNFAPRDGFCWSCGEQIFNHISLETASSQDITGCPCCSRSYCD